MHETIGIWAREQLAVLDGGWDRLTGVLDRLGTDGFDRPLTATWNVKEMLAHLAFWEETSLEVINTIFRGGPELPVEQSARLRTPHGWRTTRCPARAATVSKSGE